MLYVSITIDTEDLNTPFFNGLYNDSIFHHKNTSELLCEIFKELGVEATFFVAVHQKYKLKDGTTEKLLEFLKKIIRIFSCTLTRSGRIKKIVSTCGSIACRNKRRLLVMVSKLSNQLQEITLWLTGLVRMV